MALEVELRQLIHKIEWHQCIYVLSLNRSRIAYGKYLASKLAKRSACVGSIMNTHIMKVARLDE